MDINRTPYLTYDDIQLVPSYSEINSRKDVDLSTKLSRRYNLAIPIVASPMDTVCDSVMAIELYKVGGVGCIHRFMSIEKQCNEVIKVVDYIVHNPSKIWRFHRYTNHYTSGPSSEMIDIKPPVMAAIGISIDDKKRTSDLIAAGVNVILIDVAHGDHVKVHAMIKWIKETDEFGHVDVIAGNVATPQAAERLIKYGVDGIRVGIGGGCFTPNMKVKTSDGLKKIKDVEIGDEVYTHTGELKPVINKFEYGNFDEVYDIDGIEATANHKFYVVHQSKTDLVTDDNIHDYAEWVKAEDLTGEYFLIELD